MDFSNIFLLDQNHCRRNHCEVFSNDLFCCLNHFAEAKRQAIRTRVRNTIVLSHRQSETDV